MSDGPESELEVALDRVRSLPPIVDPRDAVVRAAVRWVEAGADYGLQASVGAPREEMHRLHEVHRLATITLHDAVAAYRAATTPTARPGAEG